MMDDRKTEGFAMWALTIGLGEGQQMFDAIRLCRRQDAFSIVDKQGALRVKGVFRLELVPEGLFFLG